MRFNKPFALMLVLALVAIQPAVFAWPFGDKKQAPKAKAGAPAPETPQTKPPVTVTQTSVADANWQKKDNGANAVETGQQVEVPNVPSLPRIPTIPKTADTGIPSIPSIPSKSLPNQEPEILRIQKQIHDIIKLNDTLKAQYSDQAAEIQKISEQAKIHQKILQDLEKTKSEMKTTNSESMIVQEKVKLIRKETETNRKFLNTLQTTTPQSGTQHKTTEEKPL